MKLQPSILVTLLAVSTIMSTSALASDVIKPLTFKNTISKIDVKKTAYAFGYQIGEGLKAQKVILDPSLVAEGMKDALHQKTPKYSKKEMKQEIEVLQQKMVMNSVKKKQDQTH